MDKIIDKKAFQVGKVIVDSSFHTQRADEAFFTFFGNDAIYSIRRTVEENDFDRLDQCITEADQGGCRRTVIRMHGREGEYRWISACVRRISDDPLYSIELSDIYSLEQLAYQRSAETADLRYTLSLMSDLSFEYSPLTNIISIYMFDCCRRITLVEADLEKWQADSIDSGYVLTRYADVFERLCNDIKNGTYRFDYEFESSVMTEGRVRELCLFRGITRHSDPDTWKVTGIISVVGANHRSKDINLAIEANRDSVSGLLNKNAITAIASKLINSRPAYNVNLVILDIDNFTEINNGYGHLFGDEVLFTVASLIKHEIKDRGYAGRISGGGFLIVLEDIGDETDLRGILRAIRTNTEYALSDRFNDFQLTCSMGISTYPIDSSSYNELFMQADKALYIAQEKGRNRYVIYDIAKHGPVEKDIENKIAYISNRKNATERLSFAGKIAESLVFGRVPDISVLLEQIRSEFGIDDIAVFSGNDMSLILSCGNVQSKNAAYLLENGYTERFSGDGIFAIDNVNELEGREDTAFAQLSAENIGGAVQYLMTEDSMVKGMISFCYIGRFKKWAVSDINYFAILGRVIFSILKKQGFI